MVNEAPGSCVMDSSKVGAQRNITLVGSIQSLLLRKRIHGYERKSNEDEIKSIDKREGTGARLATLDWILISGMFTSFIIIVSLLIKMSSN